MAAATEPIIGSLRRTSRTTSHRSDGHSPSIPNCRRWHASTPPSIAAPEVEQAFALPYAFYEEGVRRYGFHGLSYEYIASVLPEPAPKIVERRVVVAHLGNG